MSGPAAREIRAGTVLPARREQVALHTSDGLSLVGEWALPLHGQPVASLVCLHPLPTAGGMMDSHVLRKAANRLPALAGMAVLRFNTRGTTSPAGTSEGEFAGGVDERLDLLAALDEAQVRGLTPVWLVGWSFGTDIALRYGLDPRVAGLVLLSPPLRWSTKQDLADWGADGRPILALVPEKDEFLPPAAARPQFAGIGACRLVEVTGAGHLWVGENAVRRVLDELVEFVHPGSSPLPTTWAGDVEREMDPLRA